MRLHRRSFLQSILAAGFSPALGSLTVRASDATPSASAYSIPPPDEDGYELWLRYRPVADPQALAHYRAMLSTLVSLAKEPFASSIADELDRACIGMIGARLTRATKISGDGTLLIGKTTESDAIGNAVDAKRLASLGAEAFALKSTVIDGHRTTIVAATSDRGLLYGVFALIKQLQLRLPVDALDIVDGPRAHLRLANHWDDLDRNVARGYAGLSIFDFSDLTQKNPRYLDYARLLASVGINGAVINDVNASPYVLDSGMMSGYSSLADILRGWGIRLYLSVNFASPMTLTVKDAHPISTADPLDHRVQHWWSQKIDEIYKHVPDFGGFVVKANSEGEPGPLAYKRTHAQGANMLAKPLAKHGGMLIWRTFVHRGFDNWSEFEYSTFHGLDGQFAANVILQTKNGPIDFQVI